MQPKLYNLTNNVYDGKIDNKTKSNYSDDNNHINSQDYKNNSATIPIIFHADIQNLLGYIGYGLSALGLVITLAALIVLRQIMLSI